MSERRLPNHINMDLSPLQDKGWTEREWVANVGIVAVAAGTFGVFAHNTIDDWRNGSGMEPIGDAVVFTSTESGTPDACKLAGDIQEVTREWRRPIFGVNQESCAQQTEELAAGLRESDDGQQHFITVTLHQNGTTSSGIADISRVGIQNLPEPGIHPYWPSEPTIR